VKLWCRRHELEIPGKKDAKFVEMATSVRFELAVEVALRAYLDFL